MKRLFRFVASAWQSLAVRLINISDQFRIVLVRAAFKKQRVAEASLGNFRMLVLVHDSVGIQLKALGRFESLEATYVTSTLDRNATVVDVGSNVGYWSLLCASVAPKARVHCFEPAPLPKALCETNICLNGWDRRALLNQVALSDKAGTQNFSIARDSGFSSFRGTGRVREDARCTVETTTLDMYASNKSISKIHFLKIDVEGSEMAVLRGAAGLLRREAVDLLLIELFSQNLNAYNVTITDVLKFMQEFNYKPFVIDRSSRTLRSYTDGDHDRIQNVFFIPAPSKLK